MSEFHMALVASTLIAVALALVGTATYHTVRTSMMNQLESQLVEEAILFRRIYETGGTSALVAAVQSLEEAAVAGQRYASLFDASGTRLAGNIDAAPDLVLLRSSSLVATNQSGDEILEVGDLIRTETLVVGRDISLVKATLRTLVWALFAAGIVTLAVCLVVGWILSRTSVRKLRRISDTLARIGDGDTKARIGLAGNGQVDRVGNLIDAALDRLSALMVASQNTTRAIAHDLRSPLSRAFVLVQEAAGASGAERAQLLDQSAEELLSLSRVFDTVLQIGRLESSADRSGFVPIDLRDLIEEAASLVEGDIHDKGQTLSLELSGNVPVEGDPQMLNQLLVNLLVNANRHTPSGSAITARAFMHDGQAVLEISDDGPGIPEDFRAEVLKPFIRLDESRTEPGSGLGLSLVHAIAIRHGASVVLDDNRPGLRVRTVFPQPTGAVHQPGGAADR